MSDFDEGEAPEAEPEAPAAEAQVEEDQVRKLKQENQQLRSRLRRSEIETEFGGKIADIVAKSGRTVDEWSDYAAEIREAFPEAPTETSVEQTPEPAAPEAESPGLVAMSKGPASAASVAPEQMSAKQWIELHTTDPERAMQALNNGGVAGVQKP